MSQYEGFTTGWLGFSTISVINLRGHGGQMNKVINMLFCMAYLMDPYTCVMKGIGNSSTFKQFNIFLLGCTVQLKSLTSEAIPSATQFFMRAYKISHFPGL